MHCCVTLHRCMEGGCRAGFSCHRVVQLQLYHFFSSMHTICQSPHMLRQLTYPIRVLSNSRNCGSNRQYSSTAHCLDVRQHFQRTLCFAMFIHKFVADMLYHISQPIVNDLSLVILALHLRRCCAYCSARSLFGCSWISGIILVCL